MAHSNETVIKDLDLNNNDPASTNNEVSQEDNTNEQPQEQATSEQQSSTEQAEGNKQATEEDKEEAKAHTSEKDEMPEVVDELTDEEIKHICNEMGIMVIRLNDSLEGLFEWSKI